jgi:hypothetical protein
MSSSQIQKAPKLNENNQCGKKEKVWIATR